MLSLWTNGVYEALSTITLQRRLGVGQKRNQKACLRSRRVARIAGGGQVEVDETRGSRGRGERLSVLTVKKTNAFLQG